MLDSLTVAYVQYMIMTIYLQKVLSEEIKNFLIKELNYGMYGKNVEYLDNQNQHHIPVSMLLVKAKAHSS